MSSSNMPVADKKEFVIKHVFTDVMNIESDKGYYGPTENHFNVPWRIGSYHLTSASNDPPEVLVFELRCLKLHGTDDWSIETETEMKLIPVAGESFKLTLKHRYSDSTRSKIFCYTPVDVKKYLVDENLTVEMHVKITKIEGIRTEKLRSFDESTKEFSDVALVVDNEKFYVCKMYLASHFLYFKSIFFGNFNESQKSDITLNGINRWDFQNFLEVIHGEPAIDDDTIDGILKLADMYNSKTAIRRCEEFLLKSSERTMKLKFDTAVVHKMDKLMTKCLSENSTNKEAISLAPKDPSQMEPADWAEVLDKVVSFN